MNRIAAFALLVMGIVLLALGWDAYRSMSSEVARVFTGAPTNRALWLLIGGGLATVSGLGGLTRRK